MDVTIHLITDLLENGTYCLLYYSVLYTFVLASAFNLLLLSVERCHAIVRPFQHLSRFSTKMLVLMILSAWVIDLIIGLSPLAGWKPYRVDTDFICRRSMSFSEVYLKVMNSCLTVALVLSFVCFIIVSRIALQKVKENKVNEVGNDLKRDIHYTKLLLTVSGLFAICWGPYCIASFIPNFSLTFLYVKNFLASLGLLNSCVNWIVYSVKNKKFRAAFKNILTCKSRHGEFHLAKNFKQSSRNNNQS